MWDKSEYQPAADDGGLHHLLVCEADRDTLTDEGDDMAIMAKAGGGGQNFEPVSAGLHEAVCTGVFDLGIQKGTGAYAAQQNHKVMLRFECLDEDVVFERDGVEQTGPARIWSNYTLSLHEKSNLRKMLEMWRGRKFTPEELEGFDVSKLVNVPCQLFVVHKDGDNGKTYANIQGITPWPKNKVKPQSPFDCLLFSLDEPDNEVWGKLPEWLQKKIDARVADNWEELNRKDAAAAPPESHAYTPNDEIPF